MIISSLQLESDNTLRICIYVFFQAEYGIRDLVRSLWLGDVYKRQDLDVIGNEIEEVNIDALFELKNMGKTIIPDPEILKLIQDKGLQKVFYIKNGIPTAPFWIFDNLQSIHTVSYTHLTLPTSDLVKI